MLVIEIQGLDITLKNCPSEIGSSLANEIARELLSQLSVQLTERGTHLPESSKGMSRRSQIRDMDMGTVTIPSRSSPSDVRVIVGNHISRGILRSSGLGSVPSREG